MKAILCEKFGESQELVYKDIDKPTLKANQILIKVAACSINFPDTLIIQGKYQFKPDFPFSPGSDMSGTVVETGSEVKHLKVGDEVISISLCGGLAEYAALDAARCMPKPKEMSFVEASAFLYTYSTAYYALKNRGHLKVNEKVLVLGAAGGIGLAAIELAKAMGAEVIAAASTQEKLQKCKDVGADHVINYQEEDLKSKVKELTDQRGVDVVVDVVGGPYAEPSLRATAWEGRYLVIGFASGEIPKFPMNLVLLKGCQIVGVFLGAFTAKAPMAYLQLCSELVDMYKAGKISPKIRRIFTLEESPLAIEMMANRKAIGKLVVKID